MKKRRFPYSLALVNSKSSSKPLFQGLGTRPRSRNQPPTMHFAYPPRKSSNPQPYLPRGASKLPTLRRSRLKVIALVGLAFFALIWLITRAGGSRGVSRRQPTGNPPAVIVTVIDEKKYSKGYIQNIKENRIQYAEKHGLSNPRISLWRRSYSRENMELIGNFKQVTKLSSPALRTTTSKKHPHPGRAW